MADIYTLIVDDDPIFLEELAEGLSHIQIPVICATSAISAMDVFRHTPSLQVVVTDLGMPRINGLELIRSLSELRPHFPVASIIVSGMATLDHAVEAIRLNVVDLIQKPLDVRDVGRAIRRAKSLAVDRVNSKPVHSDMVAHFRALLAMRLDRNNAFPDSELDEISWAMLLDLAVCESTNRPVSVTSLCLSSGGSTTTSLRRLDLLESLGYVVRTPDPLDKRRSWVALTPKGSDSMASFGRQYAERYGP